MIDLLNSRTGVSPVYPFTFPYDEYLVGILAVPLS
jgi:hypothetical protein